MNYVVSVGDESFDIQLAKQEEIVVNEECHVVSIESAGGPSLYSLILDNSSYELYVEERNGSYRVLLLGEVYTVQVEDEASRLAAKARPGRTFLEEEETVIRSPIPGLIFDVPVTEGQEVEVGDILVIVEAMKMENELRAPRPGTVQATHVGPGDRVDKGQVLVTIA
jgi:biotin carboxyl carrier protein